MNFLIPVRNVVTGLEKHFDSKQAVANFLATVENVEHWEGWGHLGELPAAIVEEVESVVEKVEEAVEAVFTSETVDVPAEQPTADAALSADATTEPGNV